MGIYTLVAENFARTINETFASEDTLKRYWEGKFSMLPFDRTDKWNLILKGMLNSCWTMFGPEVKAQMTRFDIDAVIDRLHPRLDYNLFTQVMLNLQDMSLLRYAVEDGERDRAAIAAKWATNAKNPTLPKAKLIKNAASEEDISFNRDLSSLKAINIIAGFEPSTSFRVSHMGSTPALVDSSNISSLGIGGDRYVRTRPGYEVFFVNLEQGENPVEITDAGDFRAEGIPYTFQSKSGGDILGNCLRARRAAFILYGSIVGPQVIIPRMNSLMIVAEKELNRHLPTLDTPYNITAGAR